MNNFLKADHQTGKRSRFTLDLPRVKSSEPPFSLFSFVPKLAPLSSTIQGCKPTLNNLLCHPASWVALFCKQKRKTWLFGQSDPGYSRIASPFFQGLQPSISKRWNLKKWFSNPHFRNVSPANAVAICISLPYFAGKMALSLSVANIANWNLSILCPIPLPCKIFICLRWSVRIQAKDIFHNISLSGRKGRSPFQNFIICV